MCQVLASFREWLLRLAASRVQAIDVKANAQLSKLIENAYQGNRQVAMEVARTPCGSHHSRNPVWA